MFLTCNPVNQTCNPEPAGLCDGAQADLTHIKQPGETSPTFEPSHHIGEAAAIVSEDEKIETIRILRAENRGLQRKMDDKLQELTSYGEEENMLQRNTGKWAARLLGLRGLPKNEPSQVTRGRQAPQGRSRK